MRLQLCLVELVTATRRATRTFASQPASHAAHGRRVPPSGILNRKVLGERLRGGGNEGGVGAEVSASALANPNENQARTREEISEGRGKNRLTLTFHFETCVAVVLFCKLKDLVVALLRTASPEVCGPRKIDTTPHHTHIARSNKVG